MRYTGFLCICVLVLAGCSSRPPVQVRVLDDDLSPLRSAFNVNSDIWRAVALVSPTCSECVLGAEAVEQEITGRYPAVQVHALVVWIPMLASDNEKAARASATIFPSELVTQFYDSQQTLGTQYAQQTFAGFYERARKSLSDDHYLAMALDDRVETQRPQWDLYMLYAPGVTWEGEAPPMPTHWIRHLGRKADRKTSTYWRDTPESGPREGDLHAAIRAMADEAIGEPRQMGATMSVEVLAFEGCPNAGPTRANVESALQSSGLTANVAAVNQSTLAADDARRNWPSPTVLVNGRDLFGMPARSGAMSACRVYPTGGAPTEAEIAAALRSLPR